MLERLPLVYGILALVVALLPVAAARRLGGAGLVAVMLGTAAAAVGGVAAPTSFVTINKVLAGSGLLLVLASVVLVLRSGWKRDVALPAAAPMLGYRGVDWLGGSGLVIAAVAPHLILIGLGFLLAISGAVRSTVHSGKRFWLVPLVVGAGLLGAALVLMLTILGPIGGLLAGLPAGPFSPPAERLLVLLLGGSTLLLSALPPLAGAPWRLALSPLAAILLVRVILPGFPQGRAEWEPLAMLLLAAAFIPAALTRRWPIMAVSGGLAALWSGEPQAVFAGGVLVASGWLGDQAQSLVAEQGISLDSRWVGIPLLVPALAALPALESVLRAEVLLPTLGAAAAALGLLLGVRRRASG